MDWLKAEQSEQSAKSEVAKEVANFSKTNLR
jgi:hypothetical protein